MNTYEEQREFFLRHWPGMKEALTQGGVPAALAFINGFADALERRILYVFGRQGMNGRDDQFENGLESPSLDMLVQFADAGIEEMLAQAAAEPDEEQRKRRIDSANVISYNLGADLADCWPNDRFVRSREHFLRGLQAGSDCIRWRTELGKPPAPFSIAFWVRGMHRLSLGELEDAHADFTESLRYAEQAAQQNNQPSHLSPEADFSVILGHGYQALAEILLEQAGAEEHYEAALDCFLQQKAGSDPEKAEDADYGIQQLETVRRKYVEAAGEAAES